ncbi:hypothetical protein SAMN05216339_10969 [Nitrosomonas eutropha]|uniref:NrS-1 polymerase-like helicase domain-containing protein n=1 Tax=Nitrosomonas eutropha TaxID=916 RepID=A0A1I7IM63_9PROT|nr:primase-helicase family protein [Nitrosomonas eutropha]SFU74013.1 hypothetical protein SAMN05216339_10969 [Nitrosomonas eutropha]
MATTSSNTVATQVIDNYNIVVLDCKPAHLTLVGCVADIVEIRPDEVKGLSLFDTHKAQTASRFISANELAKLCVSPRVGAKETAPLITPFHSEGKKQHDAVKARFHALVIDHDHDDLTREQIGDKYKGLGLRYIAFTTSSHQQGVTDKDSGEVLPPVNKWKVVIPYNCSIDYKQHEALAKGAAISLGTDAAQARKQQGFYAPNKLTADAPFESINQLHKGEWLDPNSDSKLVQDARELYELWSEERDAQAQKATPKPRAEGLGVGIIGKINRHYDIRELLEEHDYVDMGKWLSPNSESGSPGVHIYPGGDGKERVYSHHGETDLLSAQNHGGHALDTADVLCCLKYGGDSSRMIREEAGELDQHGQKERQREFRIAEDRARLDPSQTGGIDVRPPNYDLDGMLANLVYISELDRISSLSNPKMSVSLAGARTHFASCKTDVGGAGVIKPKPTIDLWREHPARITLATKTFRAGAGPLCKDPEGQAALNSWRDFEYDESLAGADISPFREHVGYLFGDVAETHLDWLAHAIQKPGELPHYGWVHISQETGKGRGMYGGFLVQGVFSGYGVAGVDLTSLLSSDFNSPIAEKIIATVDEVKTGSKWEYKERLKSLINEQTRIINTKGVRQYQEYNACRWVIFSNHEDAVALDHTDRRFWVVVHELDTKPPEHYTGIIPWFNDGRNAGAVRLWLRDRDIRGFNPGQRPPLDEAKLKVIEANKSEDVLLIEDIINDWPSDVIGNCNIRTALIQHDRKLDNRMVHALKDAGAARFNKTIWAGGNPERVWIIRNHKKWSKAEAKEIATELLRGREEQKALSL